MHVHIAVNCPCENERGTVCAYDYGVLLSIFFGANVFDVLLRMFFSSSTVPDIDTIREEKLTTIDIFIRASGKGMRENL